MYSLIIADDEKIMRNSLSDIIKWDELGFAIKYTFTDGVQVLEYLKDNPVDALLVDIQMIKVSGLEVAEFIHKNSLPTKVVLLTGHRDFEYARQAVEYKVEHYLLKPVSLPEIKRVFSLLRQKLDETAKRNRSIEERQDSYERLINYEKEQFIADLAAAAFADREQINSRLELIGGSQEDLNRAFILFELVLDDNDKLSDVLKTYGLQELREYLIKVLRTFNDDFYFYALESIGYRMNGIMLEKIPDKHYKHQNDWAKFERAIANLIKMALGLDCQVRYIRYFPKLIELSGLSRQGYHGTDQNLHKIRHFVEHNYNRDITLSDIAEHVHMHPAYISKLFKEKAGMTFSEYLTDVRIEAAARLLEQPGIYVYEVCERVGYQNIKHFYKVFRKKIGCSPTEYREKLNQSH